MEKLTNPSNTVEVSRDMRGPRQHPGGYANAGKFHSNYGGPSPVAQAFNTMDKRPKAKFRPKGPKGNHAPASKPLSANTPNNSERIPKQRTCYDCGSPDHISAYCPISQSRKAQLPPRGRPQNRAGANATQSVHNKYTQREQALVAYATINRLDNDTDDTDGFSYEELSGPSRAFMVRQRDIRNYHPGSIITE